MSASSGLSKNVCILNVYIDMYNESFPFKEALQNFYSYKIMQLYKFTRCSTFNLVEVPQASLFEVRFGDFRKRLLRFEVL